MDDERIRQLEAELATHRSRGTPADWKAIVQEVIAACVARPLTMRMLADGTFIHVPPPDRRGSVLARGPRRIAPDDDRPVLDEDEGGDREEEEEAAVVLTPQQRNDELYAWAVRAERSPLVPRTTEGMPPVGTEPTYARAVDFVRTFWAPDAVDPRAILIARQTVAAWWQNKKNTGCGITSNP